jgi:hypothetical protein
MEWWNVGIMEYWEKARITSETAQSPLFYYSNYPSLFVCCYPIIPVFHSSIIQGLFGYA